MQQKSLGCCKRDSKTLTLTQTQTLTVANATRLTSDRRSLEINCGMTKIAMGKWEVPEALSMTSLPWIVSRQSIVPTASRRIWR